ncbi:thioredoxin domain-containing protein [bacterium]|nr:thioredoxin domain-containing protein [bacterium]
MAEISEGKTNRLAGSGSPYLLQHAGNPVDWHPWSPEVFLKARSEDKPVFLSIGYSTCHWCHVMEKESFSDPEVAAMMNETFVCVKVDREERPDVDHLYMTVCQLLTGSGGWPLTIVMTPDREPFFAGTYFPREDRYGQPGMMQIIPEIKELWEGDREKVYSNAREISEGIRTFMAPDLPASPGDHLSERTYLSLADQYDSRHGGFGSAPKFPVFSNLLFLMRYWGRTGESQALAMVRQTLDAMRKGGIYDHMGYGLHRYSTDERWFAPHFEKMLYDQALAVLAYTEAFGATGEEQFRETAREILSYALRDLQSPEGGFYSAEDADSEGEEGKFYTWTAGELDELLDEEEALAVKEVYNTSDAGNFLTGSGQPTGRNILYLSPDTKSHPEGPGMSSNQLDNTLKRIREKLMAARASRVRPMRDDKIMTDWNGLMIAALAKAAGAFQESSYADAAEKALGFIQRNLMDKKGGLLHLHYGEGEEVAAFLDDYAYLLWGVLELHQYTYRADLLTLALRLASEMVDQFGDTENGGFFLTPGDNNSPLTRQKPSFDGAIPSGNAVAAMSLLRLSRLTARQDLEEEGHKTLRAFATEMETGPAGFTHMISALDMAQNSTAEVIIVGDPHKDDTKRFIQAMQRSYLPTVTSALVDPGAPDPAIKELIPYVSDMKTVDGKAAAYVCRNFTCLPPTTDPQEMLGTLSGKKVSGS